MKYQRRFSRIRAINEAERDELGNDFDFFSCSRGGKQQIICGSVDAWSDLLADFNGCSKRNSA
jgi:hypothetical protein